MLTVGDVAAIQQKVATRYGETVGIKDEQALLHILMKPFAAPRGIPAYPTFFHRLSVLFQGLVQEQPFLGANRRTALVVLVSLLEARGYRFQAETRDVDVLYLGVEAGYTTWHRVTAWIKKHTFKEKP